MSGRREKKTFMNAKKVLVFGDSITHFGDYLSAAEFYFTRFLPEYQPEILNLGVSSETVSGLSEKDHPFPRPCVLGRVKRALSMWKPDLVLACYGINDAIYEPFSETVFAAFQKGYKEFISIVKESGARIVILTPPAFDGKSFEGGLYEKGEGISYSYMNAYIHYDEVMERYADFVMTELSKEVDAVIDIYHPVKEEIRKQREADPDFLHGDGIHPGLMGHIAIGRALLEGLYGRQIPHLEAWIEQEKELFLMIKEKRDLIHNYCTEATGHDNLNKLEVVPKPLYEARLAELLEKIAFYMHDNIAPPPLEEEWNGFRKKIFLFEGYEGIIVEPKERRNDQAFIWRTEFFDAFPAVDIEMVKRGFVLIHLSISNQYGSREATAIMERFGDFMIREHHLSEKCTLFGFSRGGLYAVSYALARPERTAVLYLDAPVIDLRSWPAGYQTGVGAEKEWKECSEIYGLPEEDSAMLTGWAENRIQRLVTEQIPLVIVAGDQDEVVPYEENGARLVAAYRKMPEVPLLEIIKPGVGHHPHSLEQPEPVADFIEEQIKWKNR